MEHIMSERTNKIPTGYEISLSLKKGDEVMVIGERKPAENGVGVVATTPQIGKECVLVQLEHKKEPIYMFMTNVYKKKTAKSTAITVTEPPKDTRDIPLGYKAVDTVYYMNSAVYILPHGDFLALTSGTVTEWTKQDAPVVSVKVGTHIHQIKTNFLCVKDWKYKAPEALFKDFKEKTPEHEYMAELLYAPDMSTTIVLGLKGVDLAQYTMVQSKTGSKWCAIIPKDPLGTMPALMAHCDIQANVKHPTVDNLEYNPTTNMYGSPTGLGADDRAGIFCMNKALKEHPGKFIAIFFDEEEVGCKGSRNFVESDTFKDIIDPIASCYISIDRTRGRQKGEKHVATYGHNNKELLKLFKDKLGRPDQSGSSTDCKVLSAKSATLATDSTGVSCVNFSCGYQFEHTARECLYHAELLETAEDICNMVEKMPELWTKRFLSDKTTKKSTYGSRTGYSYGGYGNSLQDAIILDGDFYDETDLKHLLQMYHYYTGKEYSTTAPVKLNLPSKNDFVNLRDNVIAGGIYGGHKLNIPTVTMLRANLWVVVSVDLKKMTAALTTDDAQIDANNIPLCALTTVSVNDPLVTYDLN